MSLNIGDNFSYLGKKFLDNRQSFDTLELMNNCSDVPIGFITFCKEDNKRYEYTESGWVELVGGGNVNIDLSDYVTNDKLQEGLANKFDNVEVNEAETNDDQTALDFYANGEVVKTVYFSGGGGGSATIPPYISTILPENSILGLGGVFDLQLDFSSSIIGRGTVKIFVNDVESISMSIPQGENTIPMADTYFTKGNNRVTVYVIDRTGQMSNSLTFYVRYGSLEITSDFDAYTAYEPGAVVRYYFTPTAVDTSLALTMYMKIDGAVKDGVSCSSDTRGYFTFPNNLEVGAHYCQAYIVDSAGNTSNVLSFNFIVLDAVSLVVASDTVNPIIEEGEQLSLDYKVYMRGATSFITKTYIDENLVNTGTCGLDFAYYRTSTLTEGIHTIKMEVYDVTETVSDYIIWTVTVTPSTYEMLQPVKAGSLFIGTAQNMTNSSENKEVWRGTDQDGAIVDGILHNFAFNSESGWVDDELLISGASSVEIPITPLANNARYGFTLDIEFASKMIGVDDALVLNLWDDEKDCGIKITTEQVILRSAEGNQADLYFTDSEMTSVMFVIDRNEATAKIYLNGVMCSAFHLSDYSIDGVPYLEDFTVNNTIMLGGSGHARIKNLRVYQVALSTDEILNNFMANETRKAEQKALVEFQKGDHLPTLTIYCDFSGLGKDDKKPCAITYVSTDEEKYGKSFTLTHKKSTCQYQGTSSMAYPIKNYRINLADETGEKWKYDFPYGKPERRYTLKADFMSSGHWTNTGLTKWINNNLYNYDLDDEKTMNPKKWYDINNGGSIDDTRECIYGFPCRLILVNDGNTPLNEGQNEPTPGNTKDMGIFNFNHDKDATDTMGFDDDVFPNCASYEVTANSDTSAGAFMKYDANRTPDMTELDYIKQSFELRFPDEDDVPEGWGFMGIPGEEGTGLKALIDWVDGCTDEEFVRDFDQHFNRDYTLRYFLLVITLGMVDNLGKNMMLDTWDNKIFMPRFYDCDTICSYDNSGQLKFDVDIEMAQGYWNTSSSRLWSRIRDLMHDELVAKYNDMRQNGMSYETFMECFYDEQIAKIPQKYYNMDYDVKYGPFADSYIGMANGDTYEHLKRWLQQRLRFVDTLYDYAPSYNNDVLTIRANTTEPMTLEIETYTPVYQHLSWYNNQMDKKKIDGKTSVSFTGTAMAATDQEVLIYGGSNIKSIKGISSMNPNRMLIGSATRLIELDAPNCPLLADINANKANLAPHLYLNKVNLNGCPLLGGNLIVNQSPLVREIDIRGTAITGLNLPSSVRNLEVLRLPAAIQNLVLNDAGQLHTLEFEYGGRIQNVSMTNCNALTNVTNFNLEDATSITLNNSYNTVNELYFSKATNLSISNMANLERIIYTPNAEHEVFDKTNVDNALNYTISTFNCPKLNTFMTTAPYRNSYGKEYGEKKPNEVFEANVLDISSTQFKDVKLLCTTDTNKLLLPRTVKNLVVDSAYDLDTEYLTDGDYDTIHTDLYEPYNTDYKDSVVIQKDRLISLVENGKKVGNFEIGYEIYPDGYPREASGFLTTPYYSIAPGNTFRFETQHGVNTGLYEFQIAYADADFKPIRFDWCQAGYLPSAGWDVAPAGSAYVIVSARYDTLMVTDGIFRLYISGAATPNIVPSSSDGSLIFSMYAPHNTTEPASGTWDMKGLDFDTFHTFGLNNDIIQAEDGSITMPNRLDGYSYKLDNLRLPNEIANYTASDANTFPTFNAEFKYSYVINEQDGVYVYRILADDMDNLPTSISFYSKTTLLTVGYINMSNVTTINDMFNGCSSLTSVDAKDWDVRNVVTTASTFMGCSALTSLNVSGWDTSNFDYLYYTFYDCSSLTEIIGIEDWDTRNVAGLEWTFRNCSSLTELNIGGWDVSKVTTMMSAFRSCDNLTTLDLSGWDVSQVTSLNNTFRGCSNLTELDVTEWDTDLVTNMQGTFRDCSSLTTLDISGWNVNNVSDMDNMMNGCGSLVELDMSNWNVSNVDDMTNMMYDCYALQIIRVNNWPLNDITQSAITRLPVGDDAKNIIYATVYFTAPSGWELVNLLEIARYTTNATGVLPTFNTDFTGYEVGTTDNGNGTYTIRIATNNLENMPSTIYFRDNSSLLTVEKIAIPGLTDISQMIENCANVTYINVSDLDVSQVTIMNRALRKCNNLVTIDVTGWDTRNVTSLYGTFANNPKLETIIGLEDWNVENVESFREICTGNTALQAFNIGNWRNNKNTITYGMFYGCRALTELDMGGFDMGNVTDTTSMFSSTSGLTRFNSPTNIGISIAFNNTQIDLESALDIIDNLAEVSSTQTLTLGSGILGLLTPAQIAVATNKGWDVR